MEKKIEVIRYVNIIKKSFSKKFNFLLEDFFPIKKNKTPISTDNVKTTVYKFIFKKWSKYNEYKIFTKERRLTGKQK